MPSEVPRDTWKQMSRKKSVARRTRTVGRPDVLPVVAAAPPLHPMAESLLEAFGLTQYASIFEEEELSEDEEQEEEDEMDDGYGLALIEIKDEEEEGARPNKRQRLV